MGPDLNVVTVGNAEQTFTSLIGQRLDERYHLTASPGLTTMDEAVAAFLREHGQDEFRLYGVINHIIGELDPAPGDALRNLAAIDDLRLFVSTTPDRLLAKALNEVRFQGRPETRELRLPRIGRQARNDQPDAATHTVVVNLFGRAASAPEYAIHEDDRRSGCRRSEKTPSLPDWLEYRLDHQSMMSLAARFPTLSGGFSCVISSQQDAAVRRSLERQQFFFVGSSGSYVPSLHDFLATYSVRRRSSSWRWRRPTLLRNCVHAGRK